MVEIKFITILHLFNVLSGWEEIHGVSNQCGGGDHICLDQAQCLHQGCCREQGGWAGGERGEDRQEDSQGGHRHREARRGAHYHRSPKPVLCTLVP